MTEPRIPCRTPAEGRDGVTHIPAWKFDAVRAAILQVLSEDDIAFKDLKDAVRDRLSQEDLAQLGSLGWHVTTVKLEMEVRDEVVRHPKITPQRISLGQAVRV